MRLADAWNRTLCWIGGQYVLEEFGDYLGIDGSWDPGEIPCFSRQRDKY